MHGARARTAITRHPTPPELRAMLVKARDDLLASPPEVTAISVAFHLPHDAAALAVVSTAEEVATERGVAHLVHVVDDVYEVRFGRHDPAR